MQEQGHSKAIVKFLFQYLGFLKKIHASSALNNPQTLSASTPQWCLQVKK